MSKAKTVKGQGPMGSLGMQQTRSRLKAAKGNTGACPSFQTASSLDALVERSEIAMVAIEAVHVVASPEMPEQIVVWV